MESNTQVQSVMEQESKIKNRYLVIGFFVHIILLLYILLIRGSIGEDNVDYEKTRSFWLGMLWGALIPTVVYSITLGYVVKA